MKIVIEWTGGDGEVVRTTLDQFIADNEFDADEVEQLKAKLNAGLRWGCGGGAIPEAEVYPDLTGKRVKLRRDVERFPYWIAKAGLTGVVQDHDTKIAHVKMDAPLPYEDPAVDEWDNCIQWSGGEDGVVWLDATEDMLNDIELIEEK